MARNFSHDSRAFPIRPAELPAALKPTPQQPPNPVTIKQLARTLKTTPERLRPLLQHDYFEVITPATYFEDYIVEQPPPDALKWLEQMFKPALLRATVQLHILAELMRTTVMFVRELCVMHEVAIYHDPAFGELLSVNDCRKLYTAMVRARDEVRFDRQALLMLWFGPAVGMTGKSHNKPLSYSRHLQHEIRRIAALPEPDRTFRASELYEAYCDAKAVGECLATLPGVDERRTRRCVYSLQKMLGLQKREGPVGDESNRADAESSVS